MIFTKTISECSQRESPYIEKTVDITILYTTKKDSLERKRKQSSKFGVLSLRKSLHHIGFSLSD